MHEKIHLFFLEVDLLKAESKLSKSGTPSQAYWLQCTCEWINDAALESSTLVVEHRTTSETEYRVVRAVSLNLRRIDDDTCVGIEVLEKVAGTLSWIEVFSGQRGKLIDACFQNFRPAAVWSWHSALVHTKAHGKVLLRKVVSQLAQSQQHSSSSGASLLPFQCVDTILSQNHQQGVTKTQYTPHRCQTWSTQKAVLAWYIVKFVIFQFFFQMAHVRTSSTQRSYCVPQLFSLLHEIFTDSHRACFKLPDSNFQRLDVVLNVAFQRDGIFLFISTSASEDSESASFPADVPINLHLYFVLEPCSMADVTQPLFFRRLYNNNSPHKSCRNGKVSWRFPPSKWAPQTQVFCVSGVFFRQIFTIHSLRCSSFARNRWKDSSPRTVLAFLHPPLPSTPQRRRLTNCTSSLGKTPHLHNFFTFVPSGT